MADIKQVTVNSTTYDIKDETARTNVTTLENSLGDLAYKSAASGIVNTATASVSGEVLSFGSGTQTVTVS